MKTSRFTDGQIIAILKQVKAGYVLAQENAEGRHTEHCAKQRRNSYLSEKAKAYWSCQFPN